MRRFLPYLKKNKTFHTYVGKRLLKFIITSGSFPMAELVLDEHFMTSAEAVQCAAKAANIALLRWQLANGASYFSANGEFVSADSEEVFNIWRDTLVSSENGEGAFNWYSIKGARNHAQATRLASFWTEQHTLHSFSKDILGQALLWTAQVNYSLVLAAALIECGADVNYRGRRNAETALNALHWVAKKTTRDAAHLAEFLLLSGADPNVQVYITSGRRKGEKVTPSMEPGAKGISKWLGKSWDELVDWAAEARRQQEGVGVSSVTRPED
ncbi:hypothetical protein BHE90_002293 [Fusarium euwallaceae]|uniref:Ankyrin repeat domain-containing protein n=1 Tax=Fusarium euwallaceae TaxID=1147111 RepID=A0A430M5I3_9HYPO|nr:hypothetical protein BHE90_002293 [Fusarium euwallaceae]